MNIEQQRTTFEAALGRGKTYTERDFEMYRLGLDRQGRGEPVGYFRVGSAGLHEQVFKTHHNDKDVFPLFNAPQSGEPTIKESLTVAEPVKMPSDDDIAQLAKKHVHPGFDQINAIRPVKTPYENTEGFKRIKAYTAELLSSYGQPAQPAASVEPEGCPECEITHARLTCTAPVAAQPSVPDGLWQQAYDKAWSVAHLYNTGAGMLYWLEAEHKRLVASTAPAYWQAQQHRSFPEIMSDVRSRPDYWRHKAAILQEIVDAQAQQDADKPASEEDARDAARYRYLRDDGAGFTIDVREYDGDGDETWVMGYPPTELDAAIDAAMQQERQP